MALPATFPLLDVNGDLDTWLVESRRHLHQHPELGFEEVETQRFILATLHAMGLVPVPVAGTGAYVDIVGALPGPLVGYRADIDALPIQDAKTDVSYASCVPGVAHLCGHDAHTTVGLGVAKVLYDNRARLRGTARVFFQPNEEGTPSGAPRMIEAGVIDGMAAVYGIHVDPTLRAGQVGLLRGSITASADRVDLVVRGPSTGHSARPHTVVDTVYLAVELAHHLYTLAGRVTDARSPAVLTLCRVEGGDAYNVIPREVRMGGTLRCLDRATRERMRVFLQDTARAFGALHGADVEARVTLGAPPVVNDGALVDHVAAVVSALRGPEAVCFFPLPSMGAEDFAYYTEHIPAAFVRIGSQESARTAYPVHDASFDLDERILGATARLMAEVVLRHPMEM